LVHGYYLLYTTKHFTWLPVPDYPNETEPDHKDFLLYSTAFTTACHIDLTPKISPYSPVPAPSRNRYNSTKLVSAHGDMQSITCIFHGFHHGDKHLSVCIFGTFREFVNISLKGTHLYRSVSIG